ncbi:MAG TPA: hypothetical protein VER96_11145 [Polyangiaceae bacterium]|nr:hypothetical protein [Polyangiaceae bacterium]
MRPTLLSALLACLFVLPLGAACSSPSDEQRPITSTPDDFCQRRCEKAHTCVETVNPAECRSSCQSALATEPKLRADFLGYVAGCVESSSCEGSSTSKCKSEAQAQLSTSQYGQSFCTAYVAAGNQCDDSGATYPENTCLEAAKTYDDSALKAANDCLVQPCSALRACLARTIPEAMLAP